MTRAAVNHSLLELAKKLKDAGFPQQGKGKIHVLKVAETEQTETYEKVYVPTYTELKNACQSNNLSTHKIFGEALLDFYTTQK